MEGKGKDEQGMAGLLTHFCHTYSVSVACIILSVAGVCRITYHSCQFGCINESRILYSECLKIHFLLCFFSSTFLLTVWIHSLLAGVKCC